MRPDVKLGVAISFVIVVVAGGYYMYRDSHEVPISVSGNARDLSDRDTSVDTIAKTERPTGATGQRVVDSAKRTAGLRPSGAASGGKTNTRLAESGQTAANGTRPGDFQKSRSTDQIQKKDTKRTSTANRIGKNGANGTPSTANRAASRNPSIKADAQVLDRAARGTAPGRDGKTVAKSTGTDGNSRAATRGPKEGARRVTPGTRTARWDGSTRSSRPAEPGPRLEEDRSVPTRKTGSASTIAVETHRLQPGDTLAGLAMSYYGSERFVRLLLDSNPQITNPDRLRVGSIVKIPPAPADDRSSSSEPQPMPRNSAPPTGKNRTYTVQSGDSFYAIAQSQLGEASRWNELFELNKVLVKGDPKRLQIGQVISLPD